MHLINLLKEIHKCKFTCRQIARKTIGIATNKICHVTTARTPILEYAIMVLARAEIKVNGMSRSTILKSDETCTNKNYTSKNVNFPKCKSYGRP